MKKYWVGTRRRAGSDLRNVLIRRHKTKKWERLTRLAAPLLMVKRAL
jgi:hypothetical protein